MSEPADLTNFNPTVFALPELPQAIGELVAEAFAEQPDAIVIDNVSKRVLVYPRGTASDRPDLNAESLTHLLSQYEIHMLSEPVADATDLTHHATAEGHTPVAFFHHPSVKDTLLCQSTPSHSSKILAPHFLLLCARTSPQSEYRLYGATIQSM